MVQNECKPCDSPCNTCAGTPNNCLSCDGTNKTRFVSDGKCYENCPKGTVQSGNNEINCVDCRKVNRCPQPPADFNPKQALSKNEGLDIMQYFVIGCCSIYICAILSCILYGCVKRNAELNFPQKNLNPNEISANSNDMKEDGDL